MTNPLLFNGQPVWSLAVRVSDGTVVDGFPYARAEAADFHVAFYWPDDLYADWQRGDVAFACLNTDAHERRWTDGWIVDSETAGDLRAQLLPRILEQVTANDANPDPGLVRRLRELRTPEAEIPALAARIMREVDAALAALHTCEYTASGADPTLDAPACGKPATVRNPQLDADYDEWYCNEHADPAWKAARP